MGSPNPFSSKNSGDTVAYSLYEKYSREKEEVETQRENLRTQYKAVESDVEAGVQTSTNLGQSKILKRELLEHIAAKIRDEQDKVLHLEENLSAQLKLDQQHNDELMKEKMELDHQLAVRSSELLQIEGRNQAFESKLGTATVEIVGIIESTKQIETERTIKKSLYEQEAQQLTKDVHELTKKLNSSNADIEMIAEAQTALETQLSVVKQEMMSLASHLQRKNEQQQRRGIDRINSNKYPDVTPPMGDVTIVFTDIEDSVALWELLPDVMLISLEIYSKILRDKLKLMNGYEVKSEAECFMVAFGSCIDAIKWCNIVQEALLVANWPERLLSVEKCSEKISSDGRIMFRGPLVRMGMHVGNPECKENPITGRIDYHGTCVNKSSRILGLAQGGQVLISELVWQQAQKDDYLINNSVVTNMGRHSLRGFQEEEVLLQVLPRTLADRTFLNFGKVSEDQGDALSIHEKMNLRKGVYNRAKNTQNSSKSENKAADSLKEGLVKEVSILVQQIEATLMEHGNSREILEDNPLSQKKKHLINILQEQTEELNKSRDSVSLFKKAKQNALKQEKNLKEELAWETEQKEILEQKVREYVKEHIERDLTIEKTHANIDSLLQLQKQLEDEVTSKKQMRTTLLKQVLSRDSPSADLENKMASLRERYKSLENELHKTELHKELRGRYLKNLEALVSVTETETRAIQEPTEVSTDKMLKDSRGKPFFGAAAKVVRTILAIEKKIEDDKTVGLDKASLMRKLSQVQTLIDQVKMEKELCANQLENLEQYFRKIDGEASFEGEVDRSTIEEEEMREVAELKERHRVLQHQLTIAQSERDGFNNQLMEYKKSFFQERERKSKALRRAKTEIVSLLEIQSIIKRLLVQEYKDKVAPLKTQEISEQTGYQSVLQMQTFLEKQLNQKKHLKLNSQQIELLGKMLKGEFVDKYLVTHKLPLKEVQKDNSTKSTLLQVNTNSSLSQTEFGSKKEQKKQFTTETEQGMQVLGKKMKLKGEL